MNEVSKRAYQISVELWQTNKQTNCKIVWFKYIWARSWESLLYVICEQQSRSLIFAFVIRFLDSITPLVVKFEISRLASLCLWAGRFQSYLVANPEDKYSRGAAQLL